LWRRAKENEQFYFVAETLACGIAIRDPQGRLLYGNPALFPSYGVDADQRGRTVPEMLRQPGWKFYDAAGTELPIDRVPVSVAIATGESQRGQVLGLETPWGEQRWVQTDNVVIRGEDGDVRSIVSSFAEITEQVIAQRTAQLAADRWYELVQSIGDAVIVSHHGRGITFWNKAAEAIFGWTAEEVLGTFSPMVPPEDREVSEARGRRVLAGETVTHQSARVTKDGRRLSVLSTLSPLRAIDGTVIGMLAVVKDVTLQEHVEEQARSLALFRDRERIAMDLHDGVIQSLYGLRLNLASARRGTAERQREALAQAGEHIDGIIESIRQYVLDLRPVHPEQRDAALGLALLAHQLRDAGIATVDLDIGTEVDARVPPELGMAILHIGREAISNVVRHARAKWVSVSLRIEGDVLELRVQDDGVGFDTERTRRRLGDGTRNMRHRAREIGGELSIHSARRHGTTVLLKVPL
jgi:PAS domain S-box-containing protein